MDINDEIKTYSEYPSDFRTMKNLVQWYSLLGVLALTRDATKELLKQHSGAQNDIARVVLERLDTCITDIQNLQNSATQQRSEV